MKKIIVLSIAFAFFCSNITFAQNANNTFTYKVGEFEVILLTEGQQKSNAAIFIGATPQMLEEVMSKNVSASAINAFLVKTPNQNYLIDTGLGHQLIENLKSVNVSPEEIQTIILTHMHNDHTGGLIKNGENVFNNAQIQIGEVELDYWTSDREMESLPENRRGNFQSARNILDQYQSKVKSVKAEKLGSKTGDGIFFIEAYGHTPGQIACLIKSGKEQLLIWADLIHDIAMQIPYPEVAVTYDVDTKLAIETRKKIMEYVAINKIPIAGMHIPYPGIGRIEAIGKDSYVFIPAN